jgi:hypothetical protein
MTACPAANQDPAETVIFRNENIDRAARGAEYVRFPRARARTPHTSINN